MGILKDRVKQISSENDTFFTGTALLDTELLMNGYYYYTIKAKQTGSTIPMVRVDRPNFRLDNPINSVEVSIKKINDVYSIVTQTDVSTELLYGGGSEYYGRGGNGEISDTYWDKYEEELDKKFKERDKALEEAQQALSEQIQIISDPAEQVRNEIDAKIAAVKAEIEAKDSVLDKRFDTEIAKTNTAITTLNNTVIPDLRSTLTNITDPAAGLIKQAKDDVLILASNKDAQLLQQAQQQIIDARTSIEDANSLLSQRINQAKSDLNVTIGGVSNRIISLEEVVTSPTSGIITRLTSLESTVNTPNSQLSSKISNLENIINTPNTGLVSRVGAIESSLSATDSSGGTALLESRVTNLETTKASKEDLSTQAQRISEVSSRVGYDPGNIIANPNAENGVIGWSSSIPITSNTSSANAPQPYEFIITGRDTLYDTFIPVTLNEKYHLSLWTNPASNHGYRLNLGLFLYDRNKNIIEVKLLTGRNTNDEYGKYKQINAEYTVINTAATYIKYFIQIDIPHERAGSGNKWSFTKAEFRSTSQNKTVEASITTVQSTAADAQGKANAIYGVSLDVNGRASGWKNINNGTSSMFSITADKFYIYNPSVGDTPVFTIGAVNGVSKLALRADMIVDGAITANKLAVGSGKNLIPNAGLERGFTDGWSWYGDPGLLTLESRPSYIEIAEIQNKATGEYWNFGANALIFTLPTPVNDAHVYVDTPLAFVGSGKWYYFQGVNASHRVTARVELDYLDASKNVISRTTYQVPRMDGGPDYSNWHHWSVKVQAPANARYARIRTVNNASSDPGRPAIWLSQYMIEECPANATAPSPWSSSGSTLIDAGMIRTGFIAADRIAANTIVGSMIAGDTITGNKIQAGSITTGHMNAGSINADRLIARTITADKIATNAVTTELLAANAVTANNIAAGAISADKLAIGRGVNKLYNSNFVSGILPRNVWQDPDSEWRPFLHANHSINIRTDYAPRGSSSLCIYEEGQAVNTANMAAVFSKPIPVIGGRYYAFSAYLNAHRTQNSYISIIWTGANDSKTYDWGYDIKSEISSAYSDSPWKFRDAPVGSVDYKRLFVSGQAPSDAVYARIRIRKGNRDENHYAAGTPQSQRSSYLFITELMFEESEYPIATPSPWSQGGSTLIDGGMISTGTINTNRLNVNEIRSKIIAADKIQGHELAITNQAGDKIQGTYIDKDGIFSTGMIATQGGFYLFRPGADRSYGVGDATNDNRIVFGVSPEGKAIVRGDIQASTFRGNNVSLVENTQADKYLIRQNKGQDLQQWQIDTGQYDLVSYITGSATTLPITTGPITNNTNHIVVTFNIQPSYRKQYVIGNIVMGWFKTISGFSLLTLRAYDLNNNLLGLHTATIGGPDGGQNPTTSVSLPFTYTVPPNTSSFQVFVNTSMVQSQYLQLRFVEFNMAGGIKFAC